MSRSPGIGRREFAQRGLIGGVGAFVAANAVRVGAQPSREPRLIGDHDILNFLLNLEYLQAEVYSVASSGRRIAEHGTATAGTGAAGDTIGGAKVSLGPRVLELATELAAAERAHVDTLRTRLGDLAVAKAALDLEALGFGFRSEPEFLTLVRLLEDLVMTAYQGVTGLIGDGPLRSVATGRALAEAQHSGVVRALITERGLTVPRFDAVDVPPPPAPGGSLFTAGADGLCMVRTASQALAALYRTPVQFASSGGFFPAGLNGVVRNV